MPNVGEGGRCPVSGGGHPVCLMGEFLTVGAVYTALYTIAYVTGNTMVNNIVMGEHYHKYCHHYRSQRHGHRLTLRLLSPCVEMDRTDSLAGINKECL